MTLVALLGLIGAEAYLGYFYSESERSLENLLNYAAMVIFPLAVIVLRLCSSYSGVPVFAAWGCIVIGTLTQLGFYQSHDPSRIMILGISTIAYWVLGFAALVANEPRRP